MRYPLELVIGILEIPQTIQAIAIVLSCPQELDTSTLLMKMPYMLVIAHRDITADAMTLLHDD